MHAKTTQSRTTQLVLYIFSKLQVVSQSSIIYFCFQNTASSMVPNSYVIDNTNQWGWITLYVVTIVIAILGNLLFIVSCLCTKRTRTTGYYLLINLSIRDILVAALCVPFTLDTEVRYLAFSRLTPSLHDAWYMTQSISLPIVFLESLALFLFLSLSLSTVLSFSVFLFLSLALVSHLIYILLIDLSHLPSFNHSCPLFLASFLFPSHWFSYGQSYFSPNIHAILSLETIGLLLFFLCHFLQFHYIHILICTLVRRIRWRSW